MIDREQERKATELLDCLIPPDHEREGTVCEALKYRHIGTVIQELLLGLDPESLPRRQRELAEQILETAALLVKESGACLSWCRRNQGRRISDETWGRLHYYYCQLLDSVPDFLEGINVEFVNRFYGALAYD